MAVPFDAERLEMIGTPVPVVPDAGTSTWSARRGREMAGVAGRRLLAGLVAGRPRALLPVRRFLSAGPDGRAMMAVEYAGDPTFIPSRPRRLFALPSRVDVGGIFRQWDVAPDGQPLPHDQGRRMAWPATTRGTGCRSSSTSATGSRELVERVPLP